MMRDKRNDKVWANKLAELGDKPPRPEFEGYSREAREIHKVAVEVVRLHRTQARNYAIPLPLEPEYPGERLKREKDDAVLASLDADLIKSNPSVFGMKQN